MAKIFPSFGSNVRDSRAGAHPSRQTLVVQAKPSVLAFKIFVDYLS